LLARKERCISLRVHSPHPQPPDAGGLFEQCERRRGRKNAYRAPTVTEAVSAVEKAFPFYFAPAADKLARKNPAFQPAIAEQTGNSLSAKKRKGDADARKKRERRRFHIVPARRKHSARTRKQGCQNTAEQKGQKEEGDRRHEIDAGRASVRHGDNGEGDAAEAFDDCRRKRRKRDQREEDTLHAAETGGTKQQKRILPHPRTAECKAQEHPVQHEVFQKGVFPIDFIHALHYSGKRAKKKNGAGRNVSPFVKEPPAEHCGRLPS